MEAGTSSVGAPLDSGHPVTLTAPPELRRSRLTTFFRLPLSFVHLVWLALWSVVMVPVGLAGWLITLVSGRLPSALHRFTAAYVRYTVHVWAFSSLAGNPFPGFTGAAGSYPVDVVIAGPERQNRWKTAFRGLLAMPAWILLGALVGGVQVGSGRYGVSFGLLYSCAFLAWFAALARGAMPRGLHDALALALAYMAQTLGYLLLLTDRYPHGDPAVLAPSEPGPRWVTLIGEPDDGRRNRLTVLLRFVLVLPHVVVMYLWLLLVQILVIINWFALVITGRAPAPFMRMTAAFVRYAMQVVAYLMLLTQRYPRFGGGGGRRYTVDTRFGPFERQSRWKVLLRFFLALPADLLASSYGNVMFTAAFLGWFAALVTGRMPAGLRRLGLASLWYMTEAYAYSFLLTDLYPQSSPAVPPVEPSSPGALEVVGA